MFSVPIATETKIKEYTRHKVERKFPYCDYHIKGTSDWNYGFTDRAFTVEEREVDEVPFSSQKAPLVIKTKLSHVDWGYEPRFAGKICAKVPHSRDALDEGQTVEMVPYGCAKLRMTELPIVNKK